MKLILASLLISFSLLNFFASYAQENKTLISEETEDCLECHAELHPGLVKSWENGRHSFVTPAQALAKEKIKRRISTEIIDKSLLNTVVGCYECHSLNTDKHADSFEHNGYTINVIVSPNDCAVCHKTEVDEYAENIMSQAYGNLMNNEVYMDLKKTITGHYSMKKMIFQLQTIILIQIEMPAYIAMEQKLQLMEHIQKKQILATSLFQNLLVGLTKG